MPIRLSLPVSAHLETTQTNTPEYDDDGNMTRMSAGSGVMTYNAENRLSSVEYKTLAGDVNGDGETNLADAISALQVVAGVGNTGTTDGDINGDYRIGIEEAVYCLRVAAGLENPVVTERKLVFTYDYKGRRVKKAVYSGNADTPDRTVFFVWNGWNMIEEITGQGDTESSRYFVWGLDISQSFEGAGGIGGLLCAVNGDAVYNYLYDGNGNIGQVVNAGTGAVVAHYEYDPFGNLTAKSGLYADANPFRFSTKYLDAETGLYYYGKRYYLPELGRWINRDPIGEEGGINLYGFVGNESVDLLDFLGLKCVRIIIYTTSIKKSDEYTFENAANKLRAEYGTSLEIVSKKVSTGEEIVGVLNNQKDDSIISFDVFSHSNMGGIHIAKKLDPPEKALWMQRKLHLRLRAGDQTEEDAMYMEESYHGLYGGYTDAKTVGAYYNQKAGDGIAYIKNIDFNKFAKNSMIEFHGCKTAQQLQIGGHSFSYNFAINFSNELSSAGKTGSKVTGHVYRSSPTANHDYKRGLRRVYQDGELLEQIQ